MEQTLQLLDYIATQEEAVLTYSASDMKLAVHSDASYLSEPQARSRAGGHFFLSNEATIPANNGAVLNIAHIIKHVMMSAPSENRTQLLIDNADELEKWLEKDGSTDQELAYWLPKYILMRGDKPTADMGAMSPRMKALAQSQDKIGCHNFMEGHISIHFYEVQNFHLAMSSSFLNGADWVKQLISKILHITHFQWISATFLSITREMAISTRRR